MAQNDPHPDGHKAASAFIEEIYNSLVASGHVRLSVDNLPYTEDFERVYLRANARYPRTRNEVHRSLMNARKQGRCKAPSRETTS
jgi:hypothetical protein